MRSWGMTAIMYTALVQAPLENHSYPKIWVTQNAEEQVQRKNTKITKRKKNLSEEQKSLKEMYDNFTTK